MFQSVPSTGGKHLFVLERYDHGTHSHGEGSGAACASTICGGRPEYLRELGVERQGDVKEKEVRWGVVASVCLILIVRSVPCELPNLKLEAADGHLLLVNCN